MQQSASIDGGAAKWNHCNPEFAQPMHTFNTLPHTVLPYYGRMLAEVMYMYKAIPVQAHPHSAQRSRTLLAVEPGT